MVYTAFISDFPERKSDPIGNRNGIQNLPAAVDTCVDRFERREGDDDLMTEKKAKAASLPCVDPLDRAAEDGFAVRMGG